MQLGLRAPWVAALVVLCWPRIAFVSGPVRLEHRTRHCRLTMVSGPSIVFTNPDDERSHHEGERARLQPELERIGDELEAALGRTERALVADYEDLPEMDWELFETDVERDLAANAYSPYAIHLLRRANRTAPKHYDRMVEVAMERSFTLLITYPVGAGDLEVRVRVAGGTRPEQLPRLERAVRAVVKPRQRPLRLPVDAPQGGGEPDVRTPRVEIRISGRSGEETARLARRLARRIDAEIASVKDAPPRSYDGLFQLSIVKGGYRVDETPVGGGFTSPFLAEVPPEIELLVTLRTVETDRGGSLDAALTQRIFELARKEIPALKRQDSERALDEIGPEDWVLVHKPS